MGGLRDLKTQAWLTRNLDSCLKENDELPHDSTLGVKVLSPSAASNATITENFRPLWDSERVGKSKETRSPLVAPPRSAPFCTLNAPDF